MKGTQPITTIYGRIRDHLSPDFRFTLQCCLILLLSALFLFEKTVDAEARTPGTQSSYVINSKRYFPIPSASGFNQGGVASWYGKDFHGRRTSNGEIYDMYSMTAAHKTLPMNTMLLVRNMGNGKKTVVRVNDRGPFIKGRIIDLSYTAARKLDLIGTGVANVRIVALSEGNLSYPDLTSGEFYVQIGAFARKINAIKLQRRFTDAGHTTVIQKYFGPLSVLYRVQVYAGKTLGNAKRAERALNGHGYTGSFIIAR
jgi:rare lipoprotein A